jgi:fatty-acid desaturase
LCTNNNPTYSENSLVLSITTAGGSHVINTGLNSVQLNKWHHIALIFAAMYIDGIAVALYFHRYCGGGND